MTVTPHVPTKRRVLVQATNLPSEVDAIYVFDGDYFDEEWDSSFVATKKYLFFVFFFLNKSDRNLTSP